MNQMLRYPKNPRVSALTILTLLAASIVFVIPLAAMGGTLVGPEFSISLMVNEHGIKSYGLPFGIHTAATTGIDPLLGEVEYPPFPPGGGMLMFMTAGGNSILNLQPYTDPSQTTTFHIGMAVDEFDSSLFPITFSWPDLSPYFSGPVRFKSDINGSLFDVNMMAQNSFTMTSHPGTTSFQVFHMYIVATGPLPNGTMPVVSTVGLAIGGFQSIVNAPSAGPAARSVSGTSVGTSAWFEYGPTMLYGNSTLEQLVADGASVNLSSPFDPSSLPINTRVHFRAVAQTASGTYYGQDQIVSNGFPPPEDTSGLVKYRTATYQQWADAKDQKGKRKAVKCKPDKVAFGFTVAWIDGTPLPIDSVALWMKFSMTTSGDVEGLRCEYPNLVSVEDIASWSHVKEVTIHLSGGRTGAVSDPLCSSSPTISITGVGDKGKAVSMSYQWRTLAGKPLGPRSSLPGHPAAPGDAVTDMVLQLPMPNLQNAGEYIFGGIMQTPVNIIVGVTDDLKGAHTVYHPKYKDVLKSLVKEKKGGDIYHTREWHCLDVFDKNLKEILKAQKSLPPDKHNNRLFAEQLTLKLNIAASDSGIFPGGLGDLVYANGTTLDGKSLRAIAAVVDSFLACPLIAPTPGSDPAPYLKALQDINGAFDGDLDTVSWSCAKPVMTPVAMLMTVPYLTAPPAGASPLAAYVPRYAMDLGPDEFALMQNYPNPFNPTTTIAFELREPALVTLSVYNALGQRVAELLHDEPLDGGEQEVEFDASGYSSGVYFYVINARGAEGSSTLFARSMKMILMK